MSIVGDFVVAAVDHITTAGLFSTSHRGFRLFCQKICLFRLVTNHEGALSKLVGGPVQPSNFRTQYTEDRVSAIDGLEPTGETPKQLEATAYQGDSS